MRGEKEVLFVGPTNCNSSRPLAHMRLAKWRAHRNKPRKKIKGQGPFKRQFATQKVDDGVRKRRGAAKAIPYRTVIRLLEDNERRDATGPHCRAATTSREAQKDKSVADLLSNQQGDECHWSTGDEKKFQFSASVVTLAA